MCEGGQQGVPLHHQQDPAGGADQVLYNVQYITLYSVYVQRHLKYHLQVPDRRPDVHGPALSIKLLQTALSRYHPPHQVLHTLYCTLYHVNCKL